MAYQPHTLRRHTISFKHAFDGLVHTFTHQPNLRVHLFIALLVLAAGIVLDISVIDWALLILAICWVITAEMVNTAIEAVVDLVTNQYHQQAKIAKDVSAGMVLVGVIAAVAIASVVFIPHLIALVNSLQ